MTTLKIAGATLTRVGYADIEIDPLAAALTRDDVLATEWASPIWATGDQVRVGAAAWIIDSDGARIVVDPALAADAILRSDADAATHQEAFAALLAAAGFPRESVTHAIGTHIDGIGMFAWRADDGSWTRFFPNAPLLLSQHELDAFDNGYHASGGVVLAELRALGVVEPVADVATVTDDVTVEFTGAHGPGHQIVRIGSVADSAVIIGHLSVSPITLAAGQPEGAHIDDAAGWAVLKSLRDSGAVLIGPLWPTPGAGRWDGERFVAISS